MPGIMITIPDSEYDWLRDDASKNYRSIRSHSTWVIADYIRKQIEAEAFKLMEASRLREQEWNKKNGHTKT